MLKNFYLWYFDCSDTTQQNVLHFHFILLVAPTIITPSDGFRKTLDFGDELNVTCTAKANPHATVTWITNTSDQRQVLEKGVGSVQLFISSVDEEDYKRYKCVASNSYGTATAFLTVEKGMNYRCVEHTAPYNFCFTVCLQLYMFSTFPVLVFVVLHECNVVEMITPNLKDRLLHC